MQSDITKKRWASIRTRCHHYCTPTRGERREVVGGAPLGGCGRSSPGGCGWSSPGRLWAELPRVVVGGAPPGGCGRSSPGRLWVELRNVYCLVGASYLQINSQIQNEQTENRFGVIFYVHFGVILYIHT